MSELKHSKKNEVFHVLILLVTAMIWGFAFVSQSVGAEYVGPYTFLAIRSWLAVVVLVPVILIIGNIKKSGGKPSGVPHGTTRIRQYIFGGIACGLLLFCASTAQQIGIAYTTTAKAGFITALYVILVPIISIFLGSLPEKKIWFCVVLAIFGLYLLCMTGGEGGLTKGDMILIVCAFLYSFQILAVNYFVQYVDGVWLSMMQMLTTAIAATLCMCLFETPTAEALRAALPSLLYAGIMSSGVAYTLQIIGQEGLDPTIASMTMCLESVFGAVGGWLFLQQTLTARELTGCVLMFSAIILSQLPSRKKQ